MLKRFKSVSLLLFLLTASTGTVSALSGSASSGVRVVQQNGKCSGVVKDATGETIIGASVVVKGTTNGTITGIDGDFTLPDVKKGDIIQVSFVGYTTQEVTWNGQPLNITLKEDTKLLDEVVITAYGGKQLRSKVTNSIAKVVGIVIGHDERALKLTRTPGVDAEVGAQFHGATHSLGNIDKRAIGENS